MKKESQFKLNFEEEKKITSPENTERLEVAKKYNVLDPEKLEKKEDGKWYMQGLPVEDWDRLFQKEEGEEYWKK
jgi:hypothetical protein